MPTQKVPLPIQRNYNNGFLGPMSSHPKRHLDTWHMVVIDVQKHRPRCIVNNRPHQALTRSAEMRPEMVGMCTK